MKQRKLLECLRNKNIYNVRLKNGLVDSRLFFNFDFKFKDILLEEVKTFDQCKSKPTQFTLLIKDQDQNLKKHRVLYKSNHLLKKGDDLRKDFLVLQAIKLIKSVNIS